MEDADKMLEWKNYSETRAYSIQSSRIIERDTHYEWLAKNIQYFQIIQDVQILGAIRIQDDEISIWIDREHRKKGIAKYIIDKVSYQGMIAKIVNGNIYSFRAFLDAGFKPTRYEADGYYILQK